MHTLTQNDILLAIESCIDPYTGDSYAASKGIQNIIVDDQLLHVTVKLAYPLLSHVSQAQKMIQMALEPLAQNRCISIDITSQILAHQAQRGVALLPDIKNTIIVVSGKGGVGKSTTAANIALALHLEGAKVGLLDADIYGPSLPLMMGVSGKQLPVSQGPLMYPLVAHGISIVSIGLLVQSEQAMIWRGPMIAQALQQLLQSTNWGSLDYLVIDTPPGTGDILLTLTQKVPITGAVIVTTPQEMALNVTARGITMLNKMHIPLLGWVENMALHTCSECGHVESIFGEHRQQPWMQEEGLDLLGSLPLEKTIRDHADCGCPTVVAEPNSASAQTYRDIALRSAAKIGQMPRDFSSKLPKVTVHPH